MKLWLNDGDHCTAYVAGGVAFDGSSAWFEFGGDDGVESIDYGIDAREDGLDVLEGIDRIRKVLDYVERELRHHVDGLPVKGPTF